MLEDVHWADEGTLDVLRLLGRRIDGVPSLAVVTFRDEADHPLRVVLGELATVPAVERIRLPPRATRCWHGRPTSAPRRRSCSSAWP